MTTSESVSNSATHGPLPPEAKAGDKPPTGVGADLSDSGLLAIANIKEGDRVLDIKARYGNLILLAAHKVGPEGRAIGLEVSADMVSFARSNASKLGLKPPQVAFVRCSLDEPLPIASNSVDHVLSNCVVNPLPLEEKANLLKETYRVLKPGGRLVLNEVVTKGPPESHSSPSIGAIDEYKKLFADAEFKDVIFLDTKGNLNVLKAVASKPHVELLLRWSEAFPVAKSQPPVISAEEVAALIHSSDKGTNEFAVIDTRRGDYEGGHVAGSFQRHAQTFYNDLDSFHREFGGRKKLVFYCVSSRGRGPRCGGWYQDYLNELTAHDEDGAGKNEPKPEVLVLEGGMKAWLKKFAGDSPDLIEND